MKKAKRFKKQTQQILFSQLSGFLSNYKIEGKKKKIENDLKKFSKVLAADIVKGEGKKNRRLRLMDKYMGDS
jgi:hypothetical protein